MDKDDLWIRKQLLQDKLDIILQQFENNTDIEIKRIDLMRLEESTGKIYTRITLKV